MLPGLPHSPDQLSPKVAAQAAEQSGNAMQLEQVWQWQQLATSVLPGLPHVPVAPAPKVAAQAAEQSGNAMQREQSMTLFSTPAGTGAMLATMGRAMMMEDSMLCVDLVRSSRAP